MLMQNLVCLFVCLFFFFGGGGGGEIRYIMGNVEVAYWLKTSKGLTN